MNQVLISVGLILLSSAVSFLVAWFMWKSARRDAANIKEADRISIQHDKLDARVLELEKQLSAVGQAVLPISTAFQAILIKELTHFHTPEMDSLMTKIGPPSRLTLTEEHNLALLLAQRAEDMAAQIPDSERDAALMLPLVIKRAKAEWEAVGNAPMKLKIVTIAASHEDKEIP